MAGTRILFEGYQDRVAIISGRILFEFSPGRGMFTITLADRGHVLWGATAGFRSRAKVIDLSSYPEVRWRVVDLSDNLGEGKAFVVYLTGKPELPSLTADFSFYEERDIVGIGLHVDNTTGHAVALKELFPIFCRGRGRKLAFGKIGDCKVLRDNWATLDGDVHLCSLERGRSVGAPNSLLLYDRRGGAALVSGIFEPAKCMTSFHVSCPEGEQDSLEFLVRQRPLVGSTAREEGSDIILDDNQSFSSGRIVLVYREQPLDALEEYAASVGVMNEIPRPQHIPCGWSCRTHHEGGLTEQQVLSKADFVAAQLKRYGLKEILIDAGWQVFGAFSGGPWDPGPSFPNGMKSVVEKVHSKGLKVGVWFRPFEFESMRLDPSSVFAKRLLKKEAAKLTREWGFDFVKIDFVDWDVFGREDRFLPEDDSLTTNEAVRTVLQAMKEGLRPDSFLLGLGAAFPASLGLVQGAGVVRKVEAGRWQTVRESGVKAAALRYHLHNRLWVNDPGYLTIGRPATLSQARSWASLVALSGGCVCVGDSLSSLSQKKISIIKKVAPPYGEAARPVDLLERMKPQVWVLDVHKPFGKWHIVGLFNWDPTPKEIAQRYKEAVHRNISILGQNDLNEDAQRSVTEHRRIAANNRLIKKENERIASLLNAFGIAKPRLTFVQRVRKLRKAPRFRNVKLSFRKLGLKTSVTYLVYDFWTDTFLGEHRGSLTMLVKLAACRILAFHPRVDRPQFLSTNRHVTQGGVEMKELSWDENCGELRGQSDLVAGDDYSVTLHVPRNYSFIEMKANCEDFRADTRPSHLVRLWFNNNRSKTITWRAKFEKVR